MVKEKARKKTAPKKRANRKARKSSGTLDTAGTLKKPETPKPKIPLWYEVLEKMRPHMFKIRTPRGHGTGFHLGDFGTNKRLCAVATALHVIEDEEEWDQPIKLEHFATKKVISLPNSTADDSRIIFTYPKSDLAIIVFIRPADFKIETTPMELIAPRRTVKSGVEVGWCGFPGLMSNELCFFHGYLSCYIQKDGTYLVDGVAINGVSGGPVFYWSTTSQKMLTVGVITAYMPNRTLPGVSMIASVAPYEDMIKFLKNLGEVTEAAQKEKERQEKIKPETRDASVPVNPKSPEEKS